MEKKIHMNCFWTYLFFFLVVYYVIFSYDIVSFLKCRISYNRYVTKTMCYYLLIFYEVWVRAQIFLL